MRSHGHSFERIAERLTSGGIPIRAGTLKGYLSEGRGSAKSKKKASPSAKRRTSEKPLGRTAVSDAVSVRGGPSAATGEAKSAASRERSRPAPGSRADANAATPSAERQSTFVLRKDSEEI